MGVVYLRYHRHHHVLDLPAQLRQPPAHVREPLDGDLPAAGGDEERLDVEDVPLVAYPRAVVIRPVDARQQFVDPVHERVRVRAVEPGGSRIGESLDRPAQV